VKRRHFLLTSLAGALTAPLAAGAQQAGKVWRVGVLVTANLRLYDSFVDELRRLGYVDGQNIVLEFRNAEGKYERFPVLAAELVRAGVDVRPRR
jgi:putative tryptophan/tyrosine transport system substrate-binding protein